MPLNPRTKRPPYVVYIFCMNFSLYENCLYLISPLCVVCVLYDVLYCIVFLTFYCTLFWNYLIFRFVCCISRSKSVAHWKKETEGIAKKKRKKINVLCCIFSGCIPPCCIFSCCMCGVWCVALPVLYKYVCVVCVL